MRTRTTSSAIALGTTVLLLLALVVPAAAAPPDNPFVGSWETIYDDGGPVGPTEIHFQIGGRGHIHGKVSVGRICFAQFGEFVPSSYGGSGSIISEDPYMFEVYADLYCHTRSGQGKQLVFEDFYLKFRYEPETDTLRALHYPPQALHHCAWRSGSGPSSCPPEVQLILPPGADGVDVAAAGQVLAEALEGATGATVTVVAAAGQRDVYDRMCASPETAVGIAGAPVYSFASFDCGIDTSLRAIQFGSDGYQGQFMVPAGSGLEGIANLDGKTWAHPALGSMSGYIVPKGMMVLAGVEPSASLDEGSHDGAVLAVYHGAAEFGTSVVDARTWVDDDYPDVFDVVEVIHVSPFIPNDAIAFGSDFPEALRLQIEAAVIALADPVGAVWEDSLDLLYGWEGISSAEGADWAWLLPVLNAAGFTIDDL